MCQPWSEEEKDIVRKYYHIEGRQGVQKRMPHRTTNSIAARASLLNNPEAVKKRLSPPWTKEEIQLIRENYKKLGASGMVKLIPNRTPFSIRFMARKIGCRGFQKDTIDDDDIPRRIELMKQANREVYESGDYVGVNDLRNKVTRRFDKLVEEEFGKSK